MRFIPTDSMIIPEPLVHHEHHLPAQRISALSVIPQPKMQMNFRFSLDLKSVLEGKQLLLDELSFPLQLIHEHYENGYLKIEPGLTKHGESYTCHRCGNHKQHLFAQFACARCQEMCTYCRKCIMTGRVSECTPLFAWCGPRDTVTKRNVAFAWEGRLSKSQQAAAEKVLDAIRNHQSLLVWAVCGSGKTELLFPGIKAVLEQGGNVCLTAPRTDVIHELTPRLRQAFPGSNIVSLYGGSEDRFKPGELTIATTQQLLRSKQAFDVVIVDEVDAFPFSVDKSLIFAVEKAKRLEAATIYLSATPSEALRKKQTGSTIKIPVRYHQHPLPVPHFKWCGHWQKQIKQKQLPKAVLNWIKKRLAENKQAFLFLPHVHLIEEVQNILSIYDPKIAGVHAEDPLRKQKVDLFRSGDIPLLLTTTILERGVTVPNLDVAVLGSEDRIFTESALVQMAGRVGRSKQAPSGDVTFFHYGKTDAMVAAKQQIIMMNTEAKQKRLLREE